MTEPGVVSAMTVLLATLGLEAGSVIPTLANVRGIERAVLFQFGEGEGFRQAAADALDAFEDEGVSARLHRLKDGYDFAATAREILDQALAAGPDKVVFDVTGGTKVTALAAFSVAMVLARPVYYNDERLPSREATLRVPVEGLAKASDLTRAARRVLDALAAAPDRTLDLDALVGRVGRSRPVLVYHINRFEGMGVVERKEGPPGRDGNRDRRERVYHLTKAGEVLHVVLQGRERVGPPAPRRASGLKA